MFNANLKFCTYTFLYDSYSCLFNVFLCIGPIKAWRLSHLILCSPKFLCNYRKTDYLKSFLTLNSLQTMFCAFAEV